jgi:hypothetical protein
MFHGERRGRRHHWVRNGNSLPLFNGVTSLASSNVFQSTTNTNIGIGTSTPHATLDVNGAVNATTNFNLGGNPFAFGSSANQNAFLGNDCVWNDQNAIAIIQREDAHHNRA